MTNSDILIRLRYALDIKDIDMIEIFKLGGVDISKDELQEILTKSDSRDYDQETDLGSEEDEDDEDMMCSNEELECFLNGFIIFKRGRQEPKPGQNEKPVLAIKNTRSINNVVLKKLKIALSLQSDDMLEILELAGVTISKGELSAVFRKEGHKNYMECGDRYVRNFLKGLAIKHRGIS
ncbi:MAG TPA: DUF1456 family protein [Epulopiscium sp.]|nr:DUF1456 family protein [Candidatus Epulonipiscium sp.]